MPYLIFSINFLSFPLLSFAYSCRFFLALPLCRAAVDNFSHCLFLFSATLHGRLVLSHPHTISFSLSLTLLCALYITPSIRLSFFPPFFPFSPTLNINELIGGFPFSLMSVVGLSSWHGSAVVVSKPLMAQTLNAACCSSQQHLSSWNVKEMNSEHQEGGR